MLGMQWSEGWRYWEWGSKALKWNEIPKEFTVHCLYWDVISWDLKCLQFSTRIVSEQRCCIKNLGCSFEVWFLSGETVDLNGSEYEPESKDWLGILVCHVPFSEPRASSCPSLLIHTMETNSTCLIGLHVSEWDNVWRWFTLVLGT
jgi:hypothetical protein